MIKKLNELVREDIRDSILHAKDEKEKEKEKLLKELNIDNKNENVLNIKRKNSKAQMNSEKSSSSSLSNVANKRRSSKVNILDSRTKTSKKLKEKNSFIKKKKIIRQRTKTSFDYTKLNLNAFRPPNIWNFPLYKLINLKNEKNEILINEIRDVDPSKCYVDGRIQKFNKIFDTLYINMRNYWNTGNKADTWEYFYDKVLKALKINYKSNRALKREEEMKRKLEEEEKKKKEEEEKELENKMILMKKELRDNNMTEYSNLMYNSESTAYNNNITTDNKEEDKKIPKKVVSIKKIKITKDKESSVLKNQINIKDIGNTNETTT